MCLRRIEIAGPDVTDGLIDKPRPSLDDPVKILIQKSRQWNLSRVVPVVVFAQERIFTLLEIGEKYGASFSRTFLLYLQ